MQFVFGTVTEHARPLGSRPLVYFLTSSGSENDGGKRFIGSQQVHALKLQRPACPADRATSAAHHITRSNTALSSHTGARRHHLGRLTGRPMARECPGRTVTTGP
jgi:hypothetical protein